MILWVLLFLVLLLVTAFILRPLALSKFWILAIGFVLIVPSIGLYFYLGSPNFKPIENAQPSQAQIEDVVGKLKTRLVENPRDPELWRMLGWVEFNANHYQESQNAYAKAIEIDPSNLDYQSSMAEAMVQVAGGVITPEALKIFNNVLTINPTEARSRFYNALAREQSGDQKSALELWVAMLKDAKPNDAWREEVAKHADRLAKSLGVQDQALDILQQKPDDQMQMIKAMVAGLAAKMESDPQNSEGWIKLMRAYMVLKEPEKAKSTLDQALKVFKGDVKILTTAAKELGVSG
jgi:cytochrome c-type biogenesis protein CcmH